MIDLRNPYTPGAGVTPTYLAGRDKVVLEIERKLDSAKEGYSFRSVIYYGLRGVGKTVLLNTVEAKAKEMDILCCHIEISEQSNLIKSISKACNKFAKQLSLKEVLKDAAAKLKALAMSFNTTWNPEEKTFTVGFNEFNDVGTGDLSNDVTELLTNLGQYAKIANTAICFCIDEIQYAKKNELEALIAAVHRISQLRLPVIIFGAGLPKVLKVLGDTKSYAERLFDYVEIGSLSNNDAEAAIVKPAEKLKVQYTDKAVARIIEITGGYPYFIQEMCSVIWELHDSKAITKDVVERYIDNTNKKLDESFFSVRYDRCTQTQRAFIAAMVKCKKLPCTLVSVATNMNKKTKSIGPIRGQLIDKGLIYSTQYGEIDFTVPKFSEYIERKHPDILG